MNSTSTAYTANLTIERSEIANNMNYGILMNAHSTGINNFSMVDSVVQQNSYTGVYVNDTRIPSGYRLHFFLNKKRW